MKSHEDDQAAYVLHTRPYRDTSLLVDFFTLQWGRCRAVARGARRPGAKLRGTLQPFVPLQISWRGRQELKTLGQVETAGAMRLLNGNALICGLYVNELLERALQPGEPYPQLFVYYQYVLNALLSGDDVEGALRTFERQLLHTMGYGIDLSDLSPGGHYRYRAGAGLTPLGKAPLKPDPYYFSAQQLRAIAEDNYASDDTRRAAKRLMRMALEPLLGERPLRSRDLFKKLSVSQA